MSDSGQSENEVDEIGKPMLVSARDSLEEVYLSDSSKTDPLFVLQINRNKKIKVIISLSIVVGNQYIPYVAVWSNLDSCKSVRWSFG